ncbi:HAD-IA family hydrolase [Phytomonospora endophytica]|uniref:Putative hydrolase of the HAD superfamily n=1 Tax=Phytomonospora endophytica TaxID=714109 RepID=A0A841FJE1_9ACTN|nr:HAD-IA family hydrolase [Phytomonospora endophytica]MBB6035994.1 putative hydrolase of the HAD superfamily [Phytomonospora endophytica]GIG66900.1 haloacid dehalogenase [Phytomonospora endophytica]
MTRGFDAILCDVDGVVRIWDPEIMARAERDNGVPPGTLAAAAFAPERLVPAITGGTTDPQWRAAVADDLAATYGEDVARDVVEAWTAAAGAVDTEVLALLTSAREHVPVVLVSNATSRLEDDLVALGVTVDAVVNTYRIGYAKPDPRVYAHAARVAGVPPERCLFVDDTEKNAVAATEAGMTGLFYRAPADLRAALAEAGLV